MSMESVISNPSATSAPFDYFGSLRLLRLPSTTSATAQYKSRSGQAAQYKSRSGQAPINDF